MKTTNFEKIKLNKKQLNLIKIFDEDKGGEEFYNCFEEWANIWSVHCDELIFSIDFNYNDDIVWIWFDEKSEMTILNFFKIINNFKLKHIVYNVEEDSVCGYKVLLKLV